MKPDPITVLWTSIPAGLQGRRARPVLSVLVSPRLRSADGSPALLANFAPFVDWPATVAALLPSMRVQFAGGAELPVTPLDPNVLESDLWRAVFPADATAVRAFEPDDWSKHSVLTYGVVQGLQGLQDLYGATAAQFSSGPPIARHHDFRRLVLEIAGGNSQEHLVDALDKAVDFHKPRPTAHAGEPWPEPADLAGLLDFHTLVSSLGDHPRLLRGSGFVIDLVLPEAAREASRRRCSACGRTSATPTSARAPWPSSTPSGSPRSRTEPALGRVAPDEDRGFRPRRRRRRRRTAEARRAAQGARRARDCRRRTPH